MLEQQDVERAIHGRQQRDRLGTGTSDTKPDRILVLHLRFDIDQKRRDDRVGEPGHRRAHHAHKLEDGVLAKHRLRGRQAGKEIGELLAEDALASCRLWKPRGAVDLQKLLLRDPRALHRLGHS